MAIPSGSGSEVLKRHWESANVSASFQHTVPTDHIWTIISFVIHNTTTTATPFLFTINVSGSGEKTLISDTIPNKGTFIFNDKMVCNSGDNIIIGNGTSNTLNCYLSYIDQDWS